MMHRKHDIIQLPPLSQSLMFLAAMALWFGVTAMVMPVRPEHGILGLLIILLFMLTGASRRFIIAMVPFCLFGISYDWMNIWHNYEVNPNVDIQGIYEAEKAFFGINTAQGVLTPNEYFATCHSSVIDFLCGCFYLCWVPVPLLFGIWLYFSRQRMVYLHFALVFLLVNLIGFVVYYIHPAAPPWYVANYGFDFILNTPGDVAGLGHFDQMTGLGVFDMLYARNANVFAAVPSLHSAYMPIALYYSLRARCSTFVRILFAIITVGIWFTAVYTSHHYILDVLGGIGCAILAIAVFECIFMKLNGFRKFMYSYYHFISSI